MTIERLTSPAPKKWEDFRLQLERLRDTVNILIDLINVALETDTTSGLYGTIKKNLPSFIKQLGSRIAYALKRMDDPSQPLNLDDIEDGDDYGRVTRKALTGFGGFIDFAQDGFVNKNLEYLADGASYGRVLLTALTSGEVDLSKAGVINKTLANIADTTTYEKTQSNEKSMPGPNLLLNPGFEDSSRNWETKTGAVYHDAGGDGNGSNGYLAITRSGSNITVLHTLTDSATARYLEVNVGDVFYFGGDVEVAAGGVATARIAIQTYDLDKSYVGASTLDSTAATWTAESKVYQIPATVKFIRLAVTARDDDFACNFDNLFLVRKNDWASDTIASAATLTLTHNHNFYKITGTTNITTLTAGLEGRIVVLHFNGILTFTDGNNIKIAGDFVTTADDTITLVSDGTNWYEISRSAN